METNFLGVDSNDALADAVLGLFVGAHSAPAAA